MPPCNITATSARLRTAVVLHSFQTQVDETADVSLALETIASRKYLSPQARLRNRTQEADGSIPFSSTKSLFGADAEVARGTTIDILHEGLPARNAAFDATAAGWEQYANSLRLYCETGRGNPFAVKRT
jgi:hypothetical protein